MYRVVQWATGNVGRHTIPGIDAHPDLDLIGLWVSSDAKVGKDAGDLAGLGRQLGVAATHDADALLAMKPDCIVNTAMADHRLGEAIEDLIRFLKAGINVVASGPVFLQYPYGVMPDGMIDPIVAAAKEGGASLVVNGIDPGYANDWLPLVMTSISERIEQVRCMEILNYSTYNQPMVIFDIMGFGGDLQETPFILTPGVLTTAWGSVVRQIAAGLEIQLDEIVEHHERVPAPDDIEISAGTVKAGTTAGMRFEVRGMKDGRVAVVLEHVTRLRDDLAPQWPQPLGHGGYRIEIVGEPMYTVDMQMMGTDGDHNTAGLKATAMRLVNAVPAVVEAEPGLVTALDLPLITGRGLYR